MRKKETGMQSEDDDLQIISVDTIDKAEKSASSKKQKNFLFGKRVRIIITLLAIVVFLGAAYQLYTIFAEYKEGDKEYQDLRGSYVTVDVDMGKEEEEDVDESGNDVMPYVRATVDFDGLKSLNSDVVAWIQFEHVDISYPVVQGDDNAYYLTHTFKKTENNAGAVFMDYKNDADLSDMNTIIYGHNMKNGSMFGLLGQYKKAEFYDYRECFWIYTPTADYRYEIFSCYEPKADDKKVYTFWSAPCDEYGTYLKDALAAAKYKTNVPVNQDEKIITLSTCTSRGADYRFVVQGKLVETIEK